MNELRNTVATILVFLVGWICIHVEQGGQKRSLRGEEVINEIESGHISALIDKEGVCVNILPYGKMHDRNEWEVKQYQMIHEERAGGKALSYDRDPPEYVVLPHGSKVARWDCLGGGGKCADMNPMPNSLNNLKGSAWTADGDDAFNEGKIWFPHEEYEFLASKETVIKGNATAFFGFFPTNFGHCLHDNFPMVAWLRSIVSDNTTFILPNTLMYKKLLNFIDPTFSERVYYFSANEIVTVEEGNLTIAQPADRFLAVYGNTLFRHLRHWIFEHHPETFPDEKKVIIFYTRKGPHTQHGRMLEPQHEKDVLALIRSNMKRYDRHEKLLIFSGSDDEGHLLPISEQFDIFRHASTIIGPHGSGLANNIWTYPFPKDCSKRVQMLEFISGEDSQQVQNLYNGYYWVMRGMPIDWHQIVYTSNSTRFKTYINLDSLQLALDDMWGSEIRVS